MAKISKNNPTTSDFLISDILDSDILRRIDLFVENGLHKNEAFDKLLAGIKRDPYIEIDEVVLHDEKTIEIRTRNFVCTGIGDKGVIFLEDVDSDERMLMVYGAVCGLNGAIYRIPLFFGCKQEGVIDGDLLPIDQLPTFKYYYSVGGGSLTELMIDRLKGEKLTDVKKLDGWRLLKSMRIGECTSTLTYINGQLKKFEEIHDDYQYQAYLDAYNKFLSN